MGNLSEKDLITALKRHAEFGKACEICGMPVPAPTGDIYEWNYHGRRTTCSRKCWDIKCERKRVTQNALSSKRALERKTADIKTVYLLPNKSVIVFNSDGEQLRFKGKSVAVTSKLKAAGWPRRRWIKLVPQE